MDPPSPMMSSSGLPTPTSRYPMAPAEVSATFVGVSMTSIGRTTVARTAAVVVDAADVPPPPQAARRTAAAPSATNIRSELIGSLLDRRSEADQGPVGVDVAANTRTTIGDVE